MIDLTCKRKCVVWFDVSGNYFFVFFIYFFTEFVQ